MHDVVPFGVVVTIAAATGLLAVLSNRLTDLIRVPAAAWFLLGAALVVQFAPGVNPPPLQTVERLVTVALVVILFDGGAHLGRARVRAARVPIAMAGLAGTFLTAAAVAALAHVGFGLSWYVALLLGTAVAPTDPAVVFSVLGRREVVGLAGTVLEGESGANDPVGIALLASLLGAGHLSGGAVGGIIGEFCKQLAIGGAIGVAGGVVLLWVMRRVALPSEALYPLQVLAVVLLVYGVATVARGSGFLAVFAAGIVVGDARAPYKREIERFHAALASLGEIVAFVALGLTVDLGRMAHADVIVPGLVIGILLALVIRPALAGLCLLPARLSRRELWFVLLVGLKGAVPLLLGSLVVANHVADAARVYAIVVVVVLVSVVGQGSLVPLIARQLRVPMRQVEPEPWAFGVRLREEPAAARRLTVEPGSPADGRRPDELRALGPDVWVSFVVRGGELLAVRDDTALRAGDDVILLIDPDGADSHDVTAAFRRSR